MELIRSLKLREVHSEETIELIPGLPNEIARECLHQVPRQQFGLAASVSKAWRMVMQSLDRRKVLVVLSVSRRQSNLPRGCDDYFLAVFNPLSGRWSALPPIPHSKFGLPSFCQLAAVGSDLVVLGGSDYVRARGMLSNNWATFFRSVYIYSFKSSRWQRGRDMPGRVRTDFCCASDGVRMVYVVGGWCRTSDLSKSAMAYDVQTDQWFTLPDMARGWNGTCKATFQHGNLQVIRSLEFDKYDPLQRRAEDGVGRETVEAFDPVKWCWEPVEELADRVLQDTTLYPGTFVEGNDITESTYMCVKGNAIAAWTSSGWQAVAELPIPSFMSVQVVRWDGKLMVFGWNYDDLGSHRRLRAYSLDLKTNLWSRLEIPKAFSAGKDVMNGACCLKINYL
ncbi:F-box/kelch-repeat protein At1g80440-like [Punica granatum]|uniref:F-box/kelch-repeat protein At1g80440-like n=1 Tax=Punica granatum TaxID=22663 RepID=A0A6P8D6X7_PUNGR|nr:F-box/kelch-repeat protein At1g80440-like [Punica granatum]